MLTQQILKDIIEYDPKTGDFTWIPRKASFFKEDKHQAAWNGRYSYTKAGQINRTTGYKEIRIFGRLYQAHRLALLYVYGEFPVCTDHINGIRDDNRIDNLRYVTPEGNSKNARMGKNNKSGFKGVHWCKRDKVWVAMICSGGNRKNLGSFESKEDAINARKLANIEYGFHENHGIDFSQ